MGSPVPAQSTTTVNQGQHTSSSNNLLKQVLNTLPEHTTTSAREGLERLHDFKADDLDAQYPTQKLAAVLVLLHIDAQGRLAATYTTRSTKLRSHPGETALPGGRYEPGDDTINHTALREANEEVGLPLEPSTNLVHVTTLPAFVSRNFLIVIPVVYFLNVFDAPSYLDSTLKANPSEVSSIFHAPIDMFLRTAPEPPVVYGFADYEWPTPTSVYRLHWFEHPSFSSIVSGLTADVTVCVAMIAAYGPDAMLDTASSRIGYERFARGQLTAKECLQLALEVSSHEDGQVKRVAAETTTKPPIRQ
ncbi:hypothetical protein OIV83_005966 [Microbotryomycetes sp. JL201]|nr:hypothetical protein OIV83_005966 [Microbotryomycetes sp. JL201]